VDRRPTGASRLGEPGDAGWLLDHEVKVLIHVVKPETYRRWRPRHIDYVENCELGPCTGSEGPPLDGEFPKEILESVKP